MHERKVLWWSASALPKLRYNSLHDIFAFIGISMEPKNIERRALSWLSSVMLYMEANPIICSVRLRNNIGGDVIHTYVNLPYLGAVSLDVFLFCSSAFLSRAHMFWKRRRQAPRIRGGSTTRESPTSKYFGSQGPPSPPVKSTIVKGYKDQSLYKTINECQDVKKSLRKMTDPVLTRKGRKTLLVLQNVRTNIKGNSYSDGYLGMSPASLQDARSFLKQTAPHQASRKKSL